MSTFKKAERRLTRILDQGYNILQCLEDEPQMGEVKELLNERGEEIEALEKIDTRKPDLSKKEKGELRNLFTRLQLVEKEINSILANLSLISKSSLKDLALHKKAKKSYGPALQTNRVFDAQVAD